MALINVAIWFDDEYFCFGIYLSNIFFPKFFFKFFFKIFFQLFQFFFFEGLTLDASPFTETKRTLCMCVIKNMISKRSKLDFNLM